MTREQRNILRRRLAKAARKAEAECISLQNKGKFDTADDVREQWAILYQAWRGVPNFNFEKGE